MWFRDAISNADLSRLDDFASPEAKPGQRLSASEAIWEALSAHGSLMKAVRRIAPNARPVRLVAFNKSEDVNWGVPWHQDRIIAVADRHDIVGYGNWTEKSGTWHCEPPLHILEQMMFVRVHLDDTDHANGAMEIAVGSHKKGIVRSEIAVSEALNHPIEVCEARRGDVCLHKMLTLHTSKPAKTRLGRRALRIDFSSCELPEPLKWAQPPMDNLLKRPVAQGG